MTSVTPTTSNKRSRIPPIASANFVGKIAAAESDNRPSLTKEFLTCNAKSVEGTIQKGHIIKRARINLDKEEYKALLTDLKLTLWTAKIHVYVSEHSILSNPKYWEHLPADYRNLYELSRIDDDKLLAKIKTGKVHHDLTRGKAIQLKRDSQDGVESADNNSGKRAKTKPLPNPTVSPALAVLHQIGRYFYSDQIWKAFDYQNPRPNELPSKEDIETALQWIEMKRAAKSGVR